MEYNIPRKESGVENRKEFVKLILYRWVIIVGSSVAIFCVIFLFLLGVIDILGLVIAGVIPLVSGCWANARLWKDVQELI